MILMIDNYDSFTYNLVQAMRSLGAEVKVVRNDETENWRELAKIGATVTSDLATNLLAFAVSGNAATNIYWWVGTETPAVIIETKGIEITRFSAVERVQLARIDDKHVAFAELMTFS